MKQQILQWAIGLGMCWGGIGFFVAILPYAIINWAEAIGLHPDHRLYRWARRKAKDWYGHE